MIGALLLASEAAHKTLWDPTVLGVLVVLSAIGLFCGSVYLLLATNLGARLGFLVAAACLTGFMVLLSTLWMTTQTPLTSPRGRIAEWKVKQVVTDLGEADAGRVRTIAESGHRVDEQGLGDLRPAVEAALVTAETLPGEEPPEQPFASFSDVNSFLTDFEGFESYTIGGESKNIFWHRPKYAAVQFCPTEDAEAIERVCDPLQDTQWVIMEYDYGSVRLPTVFSFLVSSILFGLCLLGLHWREQDERARERAAAARVPAPTA